MAETGAESASRAPRMLSLHSFVGTLGGRTRDPEAKRMSEPFPLSSLLSSTKKGGTGSPTVSWLSPRQMLYPSPKECRRALLSSLRKQLFMPSACQLQYLFRTSLPSYSPHESSESARQSAIEVSSVNCPSCNASLSLFSGSGPRYANAPMSQ